MNRCLLSLSFLAVCMFVFFVSAAPALADWDITDGHKMHYPQMPKVQGGWDVKSSYYVFLADDWQCSATGYVNDVHTWVSFKSDIVFDPATVHLAIWSDDPAGNGGVVGEDPANNFSKPLERLWHGDTSQWIMRPWSAGPQGWFDPRFPTDNLVEDHQQVFQMNFLYGDDQAFWQEEGNIYWLEFTIQNPIESSIGWKESIDHFNDCAVWKQGDPLGTEWVMLTDPLTGLNMDMAFVITPEPSSVALLLVLLSAALAFVRRRG